MKKPRKSVYFMLFVFLIYAVLFFVNSSIIIRSLQAFGNLLIKIIPLFMLILVLMALMNFFLHRERIEKWFISKKGLRRWVVAVFAGIISSGPIFMWFPLLRKLKDRGIEYGYISCFVYARSAVKLPLLPIFLAYFSLGYFIIIAVVMIIMGVAQGIITNQIFRKCAE